MNPPMFPVQTPSGSEAQQYLHRAMVFRDAGYPQASYVNGQPNWPRLSLLTHAIELALKAFVLNAVESGGKAPARRPANHDLEAWYQTAVDCGLPDHDGLAGDITELSDVHKPHLARYPASPSRPIPDPAVVPDRVVENLMAYR
ncbi:hypothetical protein ACVW1C_005705 [Bradyrhizobium sp. USDA 4011]